MSLDYRSSPDTTPISPMGEVGAAVGAFEGRQRPREAAPGHSAARADLLGVRMSLPPAEGEPPVSLVTAVFSPGAALPLLSHPEPQTMIVLTGRLDAYLYGAWRSCVEGDVLDVPAYCRHALRNTSKAGSIVIIVAPGSLTTFFQGAGDSPTAGEPESPTARRLEDFLMLAERTGRCAGDPAKNADIGLVFTDPA